MDADEASRLSELARSLYEHRLAGSMEDALEMAKRMIQPDSGVKKSTEGMTNKMQRWQDHKSERPVGLEPSDNVGEALVFEIPEPRKVVFEGAKPETELVNMEPKPEPKVEKVEEVVIPPSKPEPKPSAGDLVGNELPVETLSVEEKMKVLGEALTKREVENEEVETPVDMDSEVQNIKLTHEGNEEKLKELTQDVDDFKKDLESNSNELDEIQKYLEDIEKMVGGSGDVIKKEEAGVKSAEIADKPATEHERSGREDSRDRSGSSD
ncbi:MAG: hypothetical protein ACE5FT_00475 [Candidatus Nanoarchaeia archaeon]